MYLTLILIGKYLLYKYAIGYIDCEHLLDLQPLWMI